VTGVQAPALVLLLAGLAPAAGTGVAGLAWLARLRLRHRIEVIRDDGVLAVIDGALPGTPAVCRYLAALEAMAARPGTGCAAARLHLVTAALPDPRDLTPGQRRVLDSLTCRVLAAARSCLIWGRPAAWLLPGPSCPVTPSPAKDHGL
jgi:hypothetical protein